MNDSKDTNLSVQNDELRRQIAELKKELEDKEWASKKTNEGIKILYRELEKTNEELKKLDQLKSDFISMVSHELRTPLTTIRESISLVLDKVLGDISKDQREVLDICRDDIDRLRRIIDNLLDTLGYLSRSSQLGSPSLHTCTPVFLLHLDHHYVRSCSRSVDLFELIFQC